MDYSDHFETQSISSSGATPVSPPVIGRSFLFLLVVVMLVLWGLVTLYSASYDEAMRMGLPPHYFFSRQAVFALAGFVLIALFSIIPLSWIRFSSYPLLVISLILMLVTLFTPFGVEKMGARRWLDLPLLPSFQPSELVKIALILTAASLFGGSGESQEKTRSVRILIFAALILVSAGLMVAQKDYSTTVIFIATSGVLLIVAGVRLLWLSLFSLALMVPMTVFLLIEPYRIRRVVSFLFPSLDPSGMNYQVNRALEAIRSGGLFGKGLGNGVYKLGIIPEVHSDFIFASFVEESGAIAVIFLAILFLLLFTFGVSSALIALHGARFISYLAFGFSTMILLQALVNLAVVTRMLPPTGIPLPFFSQGGTNLLVVMAECGLLYRCVQEGEGRA